MNLRFSNQFATISSQSFSIMSFNVLLPNPVGGDGWWCYKMYSPRSFSSTEARTVASWYERQQLIKEIVKSAESDIVCFQEASCETFASDFSFMRELGYECNELFRKGRFRPATFWRGDRLELLGSAIHRDRCLITPFRLKGSDDNKYLWVANMHLQAGNEQAVRRFRQTFDCLDTIRKDQCKLLQSQKSSNKKTKTTSPPPSFAVVLAGDTNVAGPESGSISAVDELLSTGRLLSTFREGGQVVTTKDKAIPQMPHFTDPYAYIFGQSKSLHSESPPPPTMVVEELYSLLSKPVENSTEESKLSSTEEGEGTKNDGDESEADPLELSDEAVRLFSNVFNDFASNRIADCAVMSAADVARWLTIINGKVGRGSEFRAAVAAMKITEPIQNETEKGPTSSDDVSVPSVGISSSAGGEETDLLPAGYLTLASFLAIYRAELRQGKVWGLLHDLAACQHPLPLTDRFFAVRYDRIYVAGDIEIVAVRIDGDSDGDSLRLRCLPNEKHPSDHIPVVAVLQWR